MMPALLKKRRFGDVGDGGDAPPLLPFKEEKKEEEKECREEYRRRRASPSSPRPVELTAEQRAAVDRLLSFPKPVQTLGGYAGTGKTTVIGTLLSQLPDFACCAFTGKAANVLRRKGVPASTIHSLIYRPVETETWVNGKRKVVVRFVQKAPEDVPCAGFVVDEASMVNRGLHDALRSYGRPLIYVGDHGQLPPVGGEDFNLMARPDITLETIHRNAGEIARFAEYVRKGGEPADWKRRPSEEGGRVRVLSREQLGEVEGVPEQAICAFNKTRVALNRFVRERMYGFPPDRPVKGDRIMCLQNDRRLGLFNGQQGTAVEVDGDELAFLPDGEDQERRVRYLPEQFNRPKGPESRDRKGRLPFDYAYTVTCHKAQGDEWDHVLVWEQRCRRWDHRRWAYTAASRARKRLNWVL
jgi:exodeoxyribonuclease-5